MPADATKEREFWLRLILWVQEEAAGEHNWEDSSPVWAFQSQRWLTSLNSLITSQFLLVCEYAGIEKEKAMQLRRQMRSRYGVVGGKGWRIARDQNGEKK